MTVNQTIFVPLFAASSAFFLWNCYRRFRLVTMGAPIDRFDRPAARLAGMFGFAFGQKRVLDRPFGFNHFLIFWSFIILLLANGEFLLQGLFPSVTFARLPEPLYHALQLTFDTVSLIALLCVLNAFVRRVFCPPAYLDNDYTGAKSPEALFILGMIAVLMLAFFVLHGAEIALGEESSRWLPVSALFAGTFFPFSQGELQTIVTVAWWIHAVVLLVFMNFLPLSKHMHILTAIPNTFFRNIEKSNTQPREEFAPDKRFGVSEVTQFTWKDLLDSFTCTECGRCQDVCPACSTEKPLNPRKVLHDIKVNLLENEGGKSTTSLVPLIGEGSDVQEGTISEEALWSCTTCGVCMNVCPVLGEHTPRVVKMRRYLVQEKSRFPDELLNLFENTEQRSNPWGIAPSDRAKWAAPFGDRTFVPQKTEYLFFVGCAGSFDSRSKHVTAAVATLLDAAGVDWGILGKEELCCGDSLRRLGNEYVFDDIARKNVALFKEKGVRKIVTQCPHCYTTLKNDYAQYGLDVEVIHHSELLNSLVKEGRLKLYKKAKIGKVVFHDSCYLGRHNDIYDAPRQALEEATGQKASDFPRNRSGAFCCGAGGGRMWLEEQTGSRINIARVKEALDEKPDAICVVCPYCMTMFEDGLKDEGVENVKVRDVAEVMAEAL